MPGNTRTLPAAGVSSLCCQSAVSAVARALSQSLALIIAINRIRRSASARQSATAWGSWQSTAAQPCTSGCRRSFWKASCRISIVRLGKVGSSAAQTPRMTPAVLLQCPALALHTGSPCGLAGAVDEAPEGDDGADSDSEGLMGQLMQSVYKARDPPPLCSDRIH